VSAREPAGKTDGPRRGEVATDAGWQARLRARGYRLTPQRELVLSAVEHLGHATPDEVLSQVREQSKAVNISTVYRTLELLEELGLVRHAHLSDRSPTYQSTATPDHVHLVCRGCRRVIEVAFDVVEPFTADLAARYGFATDVGHLAVFGTCAECLAGPDSLGDTDAPAAGSEPAAGAPPQARRDGPSTSSPT
jgi:Fur family ferric uptake transcriptional regulator